MYTREVLAELARRLPDVIVYSSLPAVPGVRPEALRRAPAGTRPSAGARGHLARLLWTQAALPVRLAVDRRTVGFATAPEAALLAPVPQVCVVHDLIALRFPEHFPRLRWYFARALPAVLRRCAAVVVDSMATRRDLEELVGVPRERVHVVYPGHDPRRYAAGGDPERLRRRLGLGRYLLYVGNLLPHKNVVALVRAFARIASRIAHDLVIAGQADARFTDVLAGEIARLGLARRVRLLDYVGADDLPDLYRGADLYVHPSLYEGFGLTVLEAMASGVPVVSSAAGSLPEVGGDAALWVDARDVDALAAAVERAVTDAALRATLRERGRERAGLFTWDRTGRQLVDVLHHAAGGRA